ncbi:DUF975 family protein [Enterococcus dongliensis]|uniref:DUF975 family protein n=1 Tax=Enterococcus dongliensis TaxID=2559925 RepID=UPI00288EB7E5|nr:DUF975 family protein [Enterococcus dongliensis]MDT2613053.1 DUF975 family protein [Enterococcus dongliensis]MDT2640488.1 DUF975 family protein [Enterococcus dongliensis]
MNYCPNCGAELRAGAKFCPTCGYNVVQDEPIENESAEAATQTTQETFKLELEQAEGLNITRAAIKKRAQEKLSGRYGEWCKTIILLIVARFIAGFLFQIAYVHFFANGMLQLFSVFMPYSAYGYGYNYGYGSPYASFSLFLWFLLMIIAIILIFLIAALSTAVLQWCAIHTLRGNRADGLKIFAYFIKSQKDRILKANILIAIYTFLWSLLFVIPGIIKSASYAMTNYLLEKDDRLSASEAILLSRQIMHGYKLEFLILRYSFFFWHIATIFQVTNFYVMPYQNVTEIQFLDMLYNHYVAQNK